MYDNNNTIVGLGLGFVRDRIGSYNAVWKQNHPKLQPLKFDLFGPFGNTTII